MYWDFYNRHSLLTNFAKIGYLALGLLLSSSEKENSSCKTLALAPAHQVRAAEMIDLAL